MYKIITIIQKEKLNEFSVSARINSVIHEETSNFLNSQEVLQQKPSFVK